MGLLYPCWQGCHCELAWRSGDKYLITLLRRNTTHQLRAIALVPAALALTVTTRDISWNLCNWQASETLSGVYKFELVRYVYIYIYMYGGTCAIIVAHATHT